MNNQEAFDKVVVHLKNQKWQRAFENDYCAYRTECGLMCAVGVLIPDDQYHPYFEKEDVVGIQYRIPAIKNLDTGMLIDLQDFHDNEMHGLNEKQCLSSLEEIAYRYLLEWNHE